MTFVDEATIEAVGGDGGNGCVAFRREKYVSKGGPTGGDGGHGGSVYLVAKPGMNTLFPLRHAHRIQAPKGRNGQGSNKTGKSGEDLEIEVPMGTIVFDDATGQIVGEVVDENDRLLVAAGGAGGKGNARFATSTRRAPRFATEGKPGEEKRLNLELRLLADVGLVGLPNAGKSTLISTLSAARPKIADYPFTTLVPHLGVVAGGVLDQPFVIADLPGLIAGAADGHGLGHQFLRHVERCRVLVHVVELAGGDAAYIAPSDDDEAPQIEIGDAGEELTALESELQAFDPSLLKRQRLVLGTKRDSALDERRESLRKAAEDRGLPYLEVSSVTRQGLDELVLALRRCLDAADADEADDGADDATEDAA